jgi:hypothetical protein
MKHASLLLALAPVALLLLGSQAAVAADDDSSDQSAQVELRRPGTPPAPPPGSAPVGVPIVPPNARFEMLPVPDRWRLADEIGIRDNPLNPYQQSTLKGDRPIFGNDWFLELSGISDTVFEPRAVPVPVGVATTFRPGSNSLFGRPKQFGFDQTLIGSISIIKGLTAFKPPELEFRLTPVYNYNHTRVEELGLVNVDPRKGLTRNDDFGTLQEGFIDYHIRNVSEHYDFDSIRVGIQPFSSDFRGFLFQDSAVGVRLFGDRGNNRFQYNLGWFRRVEKDTNSGLNDFGQPLRRDDVYVANLYIQDLPVHGFTSQFTILHNRNNETAQHFNSNGFLVRPTDIGFVDPHRYSVTYLGANGDGHFGRVNLTASAYYAFGNDSANIFTDNKATISSYFAAVEPSMDFDYVRVRLSGAYASGDSNPFNGTENGFDAVQENPQFAGADTSYWIRQSIPLIGGGGVSLSGRNGMLADLRSSKDEGQSNFINPGLVLLGVGADADLLPELRVSVNFNKLMFAKTEVLEVLRAQKIDSHDIGWDLSAALTYRPFDTQNVVLRLSGAVLLPGKGFRELYDSASPNQIYYSVLTSLALTY